MKHRIVKCLLVCSALAGLLTAPACREKKKTHEPSTTDTTRTATAAPASSIITTPQHMLVFMHRVKDYRQWKPAYDAHDSLRVAYGLHSYVIGRGQIDSNWVVVALKADDMDKAKRFASSADLKKAMHSAGVLGTPESYFVVATWQDTASIGRLPRSMTTLQVKDWNIWWKSFQESEQERLEHGLMARLVGHDPDDLTKVFIVSAMTDTAKAFAYFKSDLLKERMTAAGVQGEPNRHFFWLVQRY